MQVLVETEPPSLVRIVSGRLAAELEQLGSAGDSCASAPSIDFVVIDGRVLELYAPLLGPLAECPRFVVAPGEASKSMANLERLLTALAEAGLDRTSRLLAFGGGVTSDLAGLAAALFMRGIDWVSAPTTLLAQVDASVGGKTAVNLPAAKNLVGAFHQPSEVVIDTDLLATLDENEWRSGLGEVLKAALLGAKTPSGQLLFERLEQAGADELTVRNGSLTCDLVAACVAHKARVVAKDFRESGPREQLNLGHTFAHAIEHVAGFGKIPHGIAVAAGLAMALEQSAATGLLEDPELITRTAALATRLGLPADLAELETEFEVQLDAERLNQAMQADKKAKAGTVRFVLLRSLRCWAAV